MPLSDLARLVLLGALWGLAFVFIRVAVPLFGPVPLVFLRTAIGGAALLLHLRAIGTPLAFGRHWRLYVTLAVLNSALPFVLIAIAQTVMTAAYAAILVATSPLFAAVIATAWLKEPLTAPKSAGLTLGVIGVAVLVGWRPAESAMPQWWAIALALAAAMLYAIAGIYTRIRAQGIAPLASAAGSQIGAALLLAPLAAIAPPSAWPTFEAWLSVLALGLGASALTFALYFRLIERVGPVKTLTVNFLSPLFGAAGGVILLGEPVTANMVAGTVTILAGMALVLRSTTRVVVVRP